MQVSYHKMLDEIIEGCKRDERTAQKQLYERLYSRMMGTCMRYAADRDQATEILNKGFLKVFTSIKDYRKQDNAGIEAWIHRIMINTAIDHLRAEIGGFFTGPNGQLGSRGSGGDHERHAPADVPGDSGEYFFSLGAV